MDKRSKGVALAIVIFAVIALIAWQIRRNRAPSYQGKTAAEWFSEFGTAEARYQHKSHISPALRFNGTNLLVSTPVFTTDLPSWLRDPAAEGLRGLGTNAALYLASEFLRRDFFWAPTYGKFFFKLPSPIKRIAPKPPLSRAFVRSKILNALQALGTNAAPAVPALLETYVDADAFTRSIIIQGLSQMPYKPEAMHGLLQKLSQNGQFSPALDLIGNLRLRTPMACTILGAALMAGDASTKQRALQQLTYIGPNARLAVPALITALTNTDKEIRYSAASALAEIGRDAQSAAPTLAPLTNDVSELVQHAARRALQAIGTAPGQEAKPNSYLPGWP